MTLTNQLTYRGYFYDFETGLYYLQSRYYAPGWGRFVNADKWFDTGDGILGTNMYIYCLDNPIAFVDPSGEGIGTISCNDQSKILSAEYVVFVGDSLTISPTLQGTTGWPNFAWSGKNSNISFKNASSDRNITIKGETAGTSPITFTGNGKYTDSATVHVLTKPTYYNITIPIETNTTNVYLYNGTNKSNGLKLSASGTDLTVIGGSGSYFAVYYSPSIRYVEKSKVKPRTPFAVGEMHFIQNVHTGKYIDVRGGSNVANTEIQQYTFNGTKAQQWKLSQTAGGFVVFRPQNDTTNTMVMSAVADANAKANGTKMILQKYGSTYVSRRWIIADAGGGNYRIITYSSLWNANAPKCLEVQNGSTADSTQLGIYSVENTNWQKWRFKLTRCSNNVQNDFGDTEWRNTSANVPMPFGCEVSRTRDSDTDATLTQIRNSRVFVFSGHGGWDGIQCNGSILNMSSINGLSNGRLNNLLLCIYISCSTGEGGANATNLMTATRDRGATKIKTAR